MHLILLTVLFHLAVRILNYKKNRVILPIAPPPQAYKLLRRKTLARILVHK
jgi:hypothetical protein